MSDWNFGTVTLTNVTIAGNSADYGGGLCDADAYLDSSTVTLNNTIVANSTSGGDSYRRRQRQRRQQPHRRRDSRRRVVNGVNGNSWASTRCLAPLGNYGGPTETMPPLPAAPPSTPEAPP